MKYLKLALKIIDILTLILSIGSLIYILANWKVLSKCEEES